MEKLTPTQLIKLVDAGYTKQEINEMWNVDTTVNVPRETLPTEKQKEEEPQPESNKIDIRSMDDFIKKSIANEIAKLAPPKKEEPKKEEPKPDKDLIDSSGQVDSKAYVDAVLKALEVRGIDVPQTDGFEARFADYYKNIINQ